MPTLPFDFTYNLNTEDTIENEYLNLIGPSSDKKYEPNSHFFVDHVALSDASASNLSTDAFGPVDGNETDQYRTTSFVRSSASTKVYAICAGKLLIQPQTEDPTKVNLILKPAASASYAPLKIKYFIYRGVNKSDLLSNETNLKPVETDSPNFLRRIWDEYIAYHTSDGSPAPTEFPSSLIGYDITNQPGNLLIDKCIFKNSDTASYEVPSCEKGEHLGNFSGRIGLDIVLDYGDYELINQEELFWLNLEYARKSEHVFDITTIPNSTATRVKRYKEHIHQFMDASALWGSHIDCGIVKIIESNSTNEISTNDDIFNKILKKYQTKNKLYVYVQGERARSYNYYDSSRKIYGFNPAGQLNETNDWPILIEEITLSSSTTTYKELKNIELEYSVDSSIEEQVRHFSIDVISPNDNNTSLYPLVTRPQDPSGTVPPVLTDKTKQIKINFPVNGVSSCSTFLLLFANLKQEYPPKEYFNELWPVNLNSTLKLPNDINDLLYWSTYDKSRLINLDDVLNLGGIIQNKVVFDNGLNPSNNNRKFRRLYVAALKRNSLHDQNYDIDFFTAGLSESIKKVDDYIRDLYNDTSFRLYKGSFSDGGNVNSLSLFNENDLSKMYNYFHLGITDEEYNLLVYDEILVTESTPQILPKDAANVFFILEEISSFSVQNVRKFKLGLQYEDNTGIISSPLFPSSGNEVYVYTLDGFFFFSKEYSDYQEFFVEYPKCKAEFRVKQPYAGEFGFDWMRVGDTGAPGDVDYKNIVGKLYDNGTPPKIITDPNVDTGTFQVDQSLYKKLELEYMPFPIQPDNNNLIDKYYIPQLSIYPPYVSVPPPGIDLDYQLIFGSNPDLNVNRVANLVLNIKINEEPLQLQLDYDSNIFTINDMNPITIPKTVGTHSIDIKVESNSEFGTYQYIKVLASYTAPEKKIIGIIKIAPNTKAKRFSKKLLFVDVITDITGTGTPPLIFALEEHALHLKKFLRQIFTTPEFDSEVINFVSTPDSKFDSDYVGVDSLGAPVIIAYNNHTPATPRSVVDYLYNTKLVIEQSTGTKYDDYFKIFIFHDVGGRIDSAGTYRGLSGYSNGVDKLADFPNNFPSTTTHEFLHTANVPHTFAAYEASKFAKFTYQSWKTDNILDYSDVAPSPNPQFPTISLFEWQGKVAKEKFNTEP